MAETQIHPVLSGIASGVAWEQEFIYSKVMPAADVGAERFTWEKFDNVGMLDISTKRGRGDETSSTVPFSSSSVDDRLDEHAKATKIDYRDLNDARVNDMIRGAGGGSGIGAVERLRRQRMLIPKYNIEIQKEKAAAALIFTATNYPSALRISNLDFGGSTVITALRDYFRDAQKLYGKPINCGVLGWTAYTDLCDNAVVLDRIEGGATVSNPALVTPTLLANILGVERLVIGTAVTQTKADPGEAGTATDLWTADMAAFFYQDFASAPEDGNVVTPSFARMAYMTVPETGVTSSVKTWMNDNGKIEFLELTEFWKMFAQLPCGVHFTNTNQA